MRQVVPGGFSVIAPNNAQDSIRDILARSLPSEAEHERESVDITSYRSVPGTRFVYLLILSSSSDIGTWSNMVELNLATNQLTKIPDDISM